MRYAELHCHSTFSLLDGASDPERLVERAVALDLAALALTDHDDVGGAVRFATAARSAGLEAILGAELTVEVADGLRTSLVCLVESREGWGNLCTLITRARLDHPRGEPRVTLEQVATHAAGIFALTGTETGWVPQLSMRGIGGRGAMRGSTRDPRSESRSESRGTTEAAAERLSHLTSPISGSSALGLLAEIFDRRLAVECWDHALPADRALTRELIALAKAQGLPWVVANDVHYATPKGRVAHDVLNALRHGATLDEMGTRLRPNGEWYLKGAAQVARRWQGHEEGLAATLAVAERCAFRLESLQPRLPHFPLPPGVSEDEYLARLVEQGAEERWGWRRTARHDKQVAHELALIAKLGLSGYFLIVWDIVRFARREGILCQGRGSAANSAVCYCLGITAVDPIKLELLFERFLSEERAEAPDIDIDFAHRERERVLQYVYARYGREHAAMVCEHITWRGRSAVRDAARVLGFSPEQAGALAAFSDRFSAKATAEALRASGGGAEGPALPDPFAIERTDVAGPANYSKQALREGPAAPQSTQRTQSDTGRAREDVLPFARHPHEVRSSALVDALASDLVIGTHATNLIKAAKEKQRRVVVERQQQSQRQQQQPRQQQTTEAPRTPRVVGRIDPVGLAGSSELTGIDSTEVVEMNGATRIDPVGLANLSGVAGSSEGETSATPQAKVPSEGEAGDVPRATRPQDRAAVRERRPGDVPGRADHAPGRADHAPGRADHAPGRADHAQDQEHEPSDSLLKRANLDPQDPRVRKLADIVEGLDAAPRHRGIHVGGFVLTEEPLRTVVPIEPASMEDRTVIQWEKDDLDPVGLVKIDLLGLGMLTVLQDCLAYLRVTRGLSIDIGQLDCADQAVFDDLCRADTVGVFQVESRAQMNTLPRLKPRSFYDIVVQVAIIRPGPIQGDMVHPYLRRRAGLEPVTYPHPSLEPILKRTLGVPLFQEQGMQVAIAAAGFTPGESDLLRKAMGHKRSRERMADICQKMLRGMEANGIPPDVAQRIFNQINAFADYGFPESHAASFALIVYASAYLRHYYAPEFLCAMLNAQPMGFYAPGTLIEDAKRHGVKVLPVDVTRSRWDHTLERVGGKHTAPAVRLGLRSVIGLGARAKMRILEALGAATAVPATPTTTTTATAVDTENTENPPEGHGGTLERFDARAAESLGEPSVPSTPFSVPSVPTAVPLSASPSASAASPFSSIPDFVHRTKLDRRSLRSLAEAGAFDAFVRDEPEARRRRVALWRVLEAEREAPGPLALFPESQVPPGLPGYAPPELTEADYRLTSLSLNGHPMRHLRPLLKPNAVRTAREILTMRDGDAVAHAGLVIVRQRPGTAKGFVFLTLEDETGTINVVITPQRFERQALLISRTPLLLVRGVLQVESGVYNIRAREFAPLEAGAGEKAVKGRNYH